MDPFVMQQNSSSQSHLLLENWMEIDRKLTAGFSTRIGGFSKQPYDFLNLGLHVGDEEQTVIRNRQKLAADLGWSFEAWTCGEQIHSNQVAIVTKQERGKGRVLLEDALLGVDALLTDEPDILLASFYADCVPLLFWDEQNHVVGLAHAGWKGTVGAIALETVQAMQVRYGTKPENLKAAIGPAIGSCCYEVNDVVTDQIQLIWSHLDLAKSGYTEVVRPIHEKQSYIDLKEINRQIMIKAGIMASHIEISTLCTSCRTDLFFSHRKEKGQTGRMASFIGWQEG